MTTCQECHITEASYVGDSGKDLCPTCYFGDNTGTACDPGECEFQSCPNYRGDPVNNFTASDVSIEKIKQMLKESDQNRRPAPSMIIVNESAWDLLKLSTDIATEPFEVDREKPFKYAPHFSGLPVFRSPIITMIDPGGYDSSPEKKVVWKDVPVETPIPIWQWLVIIAFGCFILSMTASLLGE